MTWVVAASTFYGYGALYSDVQVTFKSGVTRDVLQKAYPVANFMASGFAGSVKIGFMLTQSLIDYLALPEELVKSHAWHPVEGAIGWAPTARDLYESAEAHERVLGSRLLIVGVSPTEGSGFGAKVYFIRFASPNFEAQIMARPTKLCSIGTGSSVREYKHYIKPLFRLTSGIIKAEIGSSGGWGTALGYSIANAFSKNPRSGISRHFNTILVARNGFKFRNTDEKVHYPDGSFLERKMPAVARSYAEFLEMAAASGNEGAEAMC